MARRCIGPGRRRAGAPRGRALGAFREKASAESKPAITSATRAASPMVRPNTETQSSDRQAGTTPLMLNRPLVGFSPTRLFRPAGTRPEPAVSVPRAKGTRPRATTEAEPELEPPLITFGLTLLGTAP